MSDVDEELEKLLQGYRPLGPPADLRGRIAAPREQRRGARGLSRASEWLPAAAAMILALLFYGLAGIERQQLEAKLAPLPPVDLAAPEIEEPLQ